MVNSHDILQLTGGLVVRSKMLSPRRQHPQWTRVARLQPRFLDFLVRVYRERLSLESGSCVPVGACAPRPGIRFCFLGRPRQPHTRASFGRGPRAVGLAWSPVDCGVWGSHAAFVSLPPPRDGSPEGSPARSSRPLPSPRTQSDEKEGQSAGGCFPRRPTRETHPAGGPSYHRRRGAVGHAVFRTFSKSCLRS